MFGFGGKGSSGLALDINSEKISIFQLDKTKKGVELLAFASCPTPSESVREGLIVDPEKVGLCLRELFTQAPFKSLRGKGVVHATVPGQSVIIRLLPVPTGMPVEELSEVVRQEATNHVPFPLEEANLDWALMPATERSEADGVARVDVILAAIQKSIVDSYWQVCDFAGIRLGAIGISSLSAIRSLAFAGYLVEDDRLTMSINLRRDGTDISIIKNGMPLFSRSVVLGMDSLVDSMSRSLDISADEARVLIPQAPLLGVGTTDAKLSQVAQISRTVLGDITDEVGRSLDFYRSQVGEVNVSQIDLSGTGSEVPTVDRFFQNRLNLEATIVDAFREVVASPLVDEARPAVGATGLGAALNPDWLPLASVDLDLNREGPSGIVLDSKPGQVYTGPVDTPWFGPALAVGIFAVVVVSGIWIYFSQFGVPAKEAELSRIESELDMQRVKLKSLPMLTDERDTLLRKKQVLDKIVHKSSPWAQVLAVVSSSTPKGLQIKKLNVSGNQITLDGSAIDFEKVSHFAINLGGTGLTSDSSIMQVKRETNDPKVVDFLMKAQVVEGADAAPIPALMPQATPAIGAKSSANK